MVALTDRDSHAKQTYRNRRIMFRMCVCIYIYMCVCVYIYIYVCVCVNIIL